jgi:hypothetical protein
MRTSNWSICALSVCMSGTLAACGVLPLSLSKGQDDVQPPVGRASFGAISPVGDLAQPLSTFSGETFSAKKINSGCTIVEVGSFAQLNLTYYVAGKSNGPYPGTFVAKGTVREVLLPSYAYGFQENFKIRSHRRQISGVVNSRREFSVQGCPSYYDNSFHITGARYRTMRSSGRTAATLTPQSFSESFH